MSRRSEAPPRLALTIHMDHQTRDVVALLAELRNTTEQKIIEDLIVGGLKRNARAVGRKATTPCGRERGVRVVSYRHDRKLIGVSLAAGDYDAVTLIAKRLNRSRASLLEEGAYAIISRYNIGEPDE